MTMHHSPDPIQPQGRMIVLSDIHANLPALRAVQQLIRKDDIVICLGDMVGYYTEPNEVCAWVREHAHHVITGNHDLYCLESLPYKQDNEHKYRVLQTKEELSTDHKLWLQSLASEIILDLSSPVIFDINDQKIEIHHIHMAHGAPENVETYIYPDKPLPENCTAPQSLLCLGHTHHPMLRPESFGLVLNPGSVGQPRDWNPMPSFAIIDFTNRRITHERVMYDWHGYAEHLRAQNIHADSITLLTRTRDI